MNDREKRILTLLSKYGALSKRQLAEKERISWGTIFKLVTRLENAGFVKNIGIDAHPDTTGKDPHLYDLAERYPLAIGIEVSSSAVTMVLTNLKKTILHQKTFPPVDKLSTAELQRALGEYCARFLEQALLAEGRACGIGLGLPLSCRRGKTPVAPRLKKGLEKALGIPVHIESPACCAAVFQKWHGKAFTLSEFVVIAIRESLSAGIFWQNNLLHGARGMAGEFAHGGGDESDAPCWCGQRGCLETQINADRLYRQYLEQVRKESAISSAPLSDADRRIGLAVLCSMAKAGQTDAAAIIRSAAAHLGKRIATLVNLLDISDLIFASDFGADGDVWLPALSAEIHRRLLPGAQCTLVYAPMEAPQFALGAALSVLQTFLSPL